MGIWVSTLFQLAGLFLRKGKPAWIVAHGLNEQAIAWTLTRIFRVPYLVHVHEVYRWRELKGWNRFLFLLEGAALRGAMHLVFPEKTRSEIYRRRYRLTNPISVVFNCPRLQGAWISADLHRDLQIPAGSFLLGYFGGIGQNNALEEAIRAVARVPGVYFILWGWGNAAFLEHLKQVAVGVGVDHRLRWPGELPENKWTALRALDASYCVYEPSLLRLRYGATASNKLMESFAAGVPALSGTGRDFRYWVEAHPFGVHVRDLRPETIAESLRLLSCDRARAKQMGKQAFQMHRETLHFEKQFEPVLQWLAARFPHSNDSIRMGSVAFAAPKTGTHL
jgi:glycosyltransferase involved in cell wall biosynthesis